MSSSKALRTVRPPTPESNTPMVGRRGETAPCSALIHFIPCELAPGIDSNHRGIPSCAAGARWNRSPVWARSWMAEECADLVGRFRRKNVLELAGLLLDLRFAVHRQAVSE